MTGRPDYLSAWLDDVVERADFSVRPIDLDDSREWSWSFGGIRHRTNRFFSVVGVRCDELGIEQPLLEQREVGTLGFVLDRRGARPRVLAHAKIEPGNVGVAQLAPSCQATASNAARVHGGDAPPHVEEFYGTGTARISSSLQSEQGTRFLDKHNRNVVVELTDDLEHGADHRWFDVDELLELSASDFLVNTDARSVLVTTDWRGLVGREPFSRYRDGLSSELARSLSERGEVEAARSTVRRMRDDAIQPRLVDLDALTGWQRGHRGVSPSGDGAFDVEQFAVVAHGREVGQWDQPMISSRSDGTVELWMGRRNGLLHFLVRPTRELGLRSLVELAPTLQIPPGESVPQDWGRPAGAVEVASASESDEGGRFYRDASRYSLVDVGELDERPDGTIALPLGGVVELLREGSWFTNEARSAFSLLLQRL